MDRAHVAVRAATDPGCAWSQPRRGPVGMMTGRAGTLLASIAVIATLLAGVNFVIASRWRAVATAAQHDVASPADGVTITEVGAADTTSVESHVLTRRLVASEADVAALETRLAALANQRAHAEDAGVYTAQRDVAPHVRVVAAQLDSCVAQVAAVRVLLTGGARVSTADQVSVAAAQTGCEQARADLSRLAAEIR